MKQKYVTFRTPDDERRAVSCPGEDSLGWVFLKTLSSKYAKYVRVNRCGRLSKGTAVKTVDEIVANYVKRNQH